MEIFDESGRKRAAEQQAAHSSAKRQKMAAEPVVVKVNPLAPGPNSLAALFTLTDNGGLQGFDATQIPAPLAAKISISTLGRLDPQVLNMAITVGLDCSLLLLLYTNLVRRAYVTAWQPR